MIAELIRDGEMTEEFKVWTLMAAIEILAILACEYRKNLYLATFDENRKWTFRNSTILNIADFIALAGYVAYAELSGKAVIPGLYICVVMTVRGISHTRDILLIYKIRRGMEVLEEKDTISGNSREACRIQVVMYSALAVMLLLEYWGKR